MYLKLKETEQKLLRIKIIEHYSDAKKKLHTVEAMLIMPMKATTGDKMQDLLIVANKAMTANTIIIEPITMSVMCE